MNFLESNCTFECLDENISKGCSAFTCEHEDLDDFFMNDCINYSKELLGKTYCFILDSDPSTIVCSFTISNDSIKTQFIPNSSKNKVSREIPNEKKMRSYPAVLIGRLGVNRDFKKQKVGTELMNFIKAWFVDGKNKTGCRFIVVDSYNEQIPISYYTKNGFSFLFKDENDEKKYTGIQETENLKTRLMYYDLIVLTRKKNTPEITDPTNISSIQAN